MYTAVAPVTGFYYGASMDIPIDHPSFLRRHLVVRPAGLLRGVKLLQNNSEVKGKRGRYEVRDDADKTRVVELKGRFIDPLPSLSIDGEAIELGRPLAWYEYAWLGLPMVLVTVGGALGGALGFGAAYSSARVFRSDRSGFAKYALTGFISISAAIIFLTLAVAVELAVS